MKSIFLIPLCGIAITGCSKINDTFDALECNRQAIEQSTCAIYQNAQAIEEANRSIEENRRQLDAINKTLSETAAQH